MKWLIFFFVLFIVGCSDSYNKNISLDDLNTNLQEYEEILINRDIGFHRIKGLDELDSSFGVIVLHGYYPLGWSSKGYEWVEPLRTLSKQKVPVWLYRYDWTACYKNSVDSLYTHLDKFVNEKDYLDSLWIIGHSFGGLVASLFSEKWDKDLPVTVHSIAAPLQKLSRSKSGCDDLDRDTYFINENINYLQWRTVHSEDGAFKKLDYDPQEVKIKNGKTILLPKKWNNGRLGHNKSIQFVAKILSD